ncbi:Cell death-related nuclease 6 [Diplonema papillatum]|nr:Cell death-related nuclease 6 [Diplonema papillatum]
MPCAMLSIVLFASAQAALQCRSADGSGVEWWTMVKLPKVKSADSNIDRGVAYAYIDSAGAGAKFTVASNSLQDPARADPLAQTLVPLYGADPNATAWLLFNDEHPDNKTSSSGYAHQKGIVGFDKATGFWLDHSVPRFPVYLNSTYNFPNDEATYGQSFLCVSIDASNIDDTVGKALYLSRPWLYDVNLPVDWASSFPELYSVIHGGHNPVASALVYPLAASAGTQFTIVAKNGEWGMDLYEDMVAPYFKVSPLLVETWQHGTGNLPAYCTPQYKYDVLSVRNLSIGTSEGNVVLYRTTNDHSKWAVAPSTTLVCIGDINRQSGQRKRGGGTICFGNEAVHAAYSGLVDGHDEC